MQHHHTTQLKRRVRTLRQGFSLIEMLVVIAVIGVIAAIAIPSVSNVNAAAKTARDQRNAQSICSMFNGAQVAGVAFASSTKEGVLDELITGVSSPTEGMQFKFTPLSDEAKSAALSYCDFDPSQKMFKYSSELIIADAGGDSGGGGTASDPEPEPEPEPEPAQEYPGPWVEWGVYKNNLVPGQITNIKQANSSHEVEVQYPYYIDGHSLISYRLVGAK